jgi:hypothetical protein
MEGKTYVFCFDCKTCERHVVTKDRFEAFLPPEVLARWRIVLDVGGNDLVGLVINFGDICPDCGGSGTTFEIGTLAQKVES